MGVDVPLPPTGFSISDKGQGFVFSWNQVSAVGANGRLVRPQDVRYRLWLLDESYNNREEIKDTTGLPKNMDGSEGPRAEKSRVFRELLMADSGLPVVLWDERRSSIEAHAILHAGGKKEKQHRKTVDAVAASLILEGYLGSIK